MSDYGSHLDDAYNSSNMRLLVPKQDYKNRAGFYSTH